MQHGDRILTDTTHLTQTSEKSNSPLSRLTIPSKQLPIGLSAMNRMSKRLVTGVLDQYFQSYRSSRSRLMKISAVAS